MKLGGTALSVTVNPTWRTWRVFIKELTEKFFPFFFHIIW